MRRYWIWGAVAALISVNVGCHYDQWQAEQRANRVLQEELAGIRDDLQSCELQNSQKDTTIASLNEQIKAKDDLINNLTAEATNLRDALAKAQAILEKHAGQMPDTVIVRQALPEPLHKELKTLAEQYPDVIEYDAKKGAVRWKADLLFPLGSDQLAGANDASVQALTKFAEIVNGSAATGFDVIVVGHTCTTPIKRAQTRAEHKTNWHLSAHRAISVMNTLGKQGVGMDRMGIMGYGEYRPIANNNSKDGKAKNRRVEIYLVPKESVQSIGLGVYESKNLGLAFLRVTTPVG